MALIERDVDDSVAVADAHVRAADQLRPVLDTADVTDLIARHPVFTRALTDAIVLEERVHTGSAHVVLTDSVSLTDVFGTEFFHQVNRTVDDTIVMADAVTTSLVSLAPRVDDSCAVTDSVETVLTTPYTAVVVIDGVVVSDVAVSSIAYSRSVDDSVSVSDVAGGDSIKSADVADTASVSDSVTRAVTTHRKPLDTIVVADITTAPIVVLADRNPFNRWPGVV